MFMRHGSWLSTVCLSVLFSGNTLATPTQLDSPDKSFTAQVKIENNRSILAIRNNKTNRCTIAWTGTAGSIEDSVEHGKERVAKMLWSPGRTSDGDRLLLVATERQRYADVYDSYAVYMFSARQERLLWTKIFGRRWDESVDWSPRCDLVATVTSPGGAEAVLGDACVVISSAAGNEVKTIHVSDLIDQGLSTVTDIESARFVSEDAIRLRLYQKDNPDLIQYIWHFRE